MSMWTQKDFLYIKKCFFLENKAGKYFFSKNPKKTSANFWIIEVNCGEIQGQFVISILKTSLRIDVYA